MSSTTFFDALSVDLERKILHETRNADYQQGWHETKIKADGGAKKRSLKAAALLVAELTCTDSQKSILGDDSGRSLSASLEEILEQRLAGIISTHEGSSLVGADQATKRVFGAILKEAHQEAARLSEGFLGVRSRVNELLSKHPTRRFNDPSFPELLAELSDLAVDVAQSGLLVSPGALRASEEAYIFETLNEMEAEDTLHNSGLQTLIYESFGKIVAATPLNAAAAGWRRTSLPSTGSGRKKVGDFHEDLAEMAVVAAKIESRSDWDKHLDTGAEVLTDIFSGAAGAGRQAGADGKNQFSSADQQHANELLNTIIDHSPTLRQKLADRAASYGLEVEYNAYGQLAQIGSEGKMEPMHSLTEKACASKLQEVMQDEARLKLFSEYARASMRHTSLERMVQAVDTQKEYAAIVKSMPPLRETAPRATPMIQEFLNMKAGSMLSSEDITRLSILEARLIQDDEHSTKDLALMREIDHANRMFVGRPQAALASRVSKSLYDSLSEEVDQLLKSKQRHDAAIQGTGRTTRGSLASTNDAPPPEGADILITKAGESGRSMFKH